ncbi:hypothetical protein C8R45DRAFT_931864 [Mycena sanguinolenta]|nr:hypothetical protein C8R45DRAFT_931864 [Mycena sanguinolenta]
MPDTMAAIRVDFWAGSLKHWARCVPFATACFNSLLASGLRRHCAGPAGNVQCDSGPRWRVGKHGLRLDDAHKRVNQRQLRRCRDDSGIHTANTGARRALAPRR